MSALGDRVLDWMLRRLEQGAPLTQDLVLVHQDASLLDAPHALNHIGQRWRIARVGGELTLRDVMSDAARRTNSYNLWEGNVGSVFQSDGYFGGESEGTLFRNWFHATCDTDITDPPTTTDQFGRAVGLNSFARNFSVVGNILGRTGYTYTYDNGTTAETATGTSYEVRYIYNLGLPNIGNGGFNGMFAPPWADMGTAVGPAGFQELDLDVAKTLIRRGNWNAADDGIPTSESLDGESVPPSLFREQKPEWFGSLTWPPFDPLQPNQSYDAIPAGYRFVHGTDPN